MTTRSSFDGKPPYSEAHAETSTPSSTTGPAQPLVLPHPLDGPRPTLADPRDFTPVRPVRSRGEVESLWSWGLLAAALPLGCVTWGLILAVFYGLLHQGEGMGSDTEQQVMNMILFAAVLAPTVTGAVLGALAWRTSRRISPAIATALNALLASLMIGMIVGYGYDGALAFAVSIGIGLVLMAAVLLAVARPWQKRVHDENA